MRRRIWGYGCDKILTPYDPIDLRKVRHLFPDLPDNAFPYIPEKRIDILLGLNFYGLHPRGDHQVVENLAAERSLLSSSGWCIGGSHPLLEINSVAKLTSSANLLKVAGLHFHPSSVSVKDSLFKDGNISKSSSSISQENLKICYPKHSKISSVRADFKSKRKNRIAGNLFAEPLCRCSVSHQCQLDSESFDNQMLHSMDNQAKSKARKSIKVTVDCSGKEYVAKRNLNCCTEI